MNRPSLEGPRLKIERAGEHLDALNREIDILFQPDANRRVLDNSFDGTWHIISIDPPLHQPPPLRLSTICGDAVHNLRCSLDYLVWQLVLAGGNKPGRWTQFPIYTDPKGFNRDVRFRKKSRGRGPFEGIDSNGQAWALIEQAQPYNSTELSGDPAGHPLAVLATLSNIDKHHALFIHMLFPKEETIWDIVGWNPEARLLEYRISAQPLSLERKTEIIRLRFSETGPDPQVYVKGALAIQPSFGDETRQAVVGGVKFAHLYIADFVEKFSSFFR